MAGNPLGHIKLIPSFRGVGLDIPRDKLLALFQAYVAQATAIVREQERLIDQIRGEAVDSPLVQRALEAVAKASSAVHKKHSFESLTRRRIAASRGLRMETAVRKSRDSTLGART